MVVNRDSSKPIENQSTFLRNASCMQMKNAVSKAIADRKLRLRTHNETLLKAQMNSQSTNNTSDNQVNLGESEGAAAAISMLHSGLGMVSKKKSKTTFFVTNISSKI